MFTGLKWFCNNLFLMMRQARVKMSKCQNVQGPSVWTFQGNQVSKCAGPVRPTVSKSSNVRPLHILTQKMLKCQMSTCQPLYLYTYLCLKELGFSQTLFILFFSQRSATSSIRHSEKQPLGKEAGGASPARTQKAS